MRAATATAAKAGRVAPLAVRLPPLHPGQRAVRDSPARFRCLAAGRRWGKTRLGVTLCLAVALRGGRAWWVAPSYPIASVGWREIRRLARQVPGAVVREGDRQVLLLTGGWVQVRSADTVGGLRGEGLDFLVVDEAGWVRESAWTEELRPALTDRIGRALFISTPAGRNWFWELWQRGQQGQDPEWQSWRLPTASNPYIAPAEIEAARAGLPERVFRQEYEADFVEGAIGPYFSMFRPVDDRGRPWHVWPLAVVEQRYGLLPEDVLPPPSWTVWCGVDGGVRDPWCVLWLARAPDRRLFVYRELYGSGVQVPEQARRLRAAWDEGGPRPLRLQADPSMFNRRANLAVSDAEIYAREGVALVRGTNAREPGWRRVAELLTAELDDGFPQLVVVQGACPNLVRTLPRLLSDAARPEDVDSDGQEDHAADALRYAVVPAVAPTADTRRRELVAVDGDVRGDSGLGAGQTGFVSAW